MTTATTVKQNVTKDNKDFKGLKKTAKTEPSTNNVVKSVDSMSYEELQQHLEAKREAEISTLEERLSHLNEEAAQIEQRIASLRGVVKAKRTVSRPSRRRAKNPQPLAHYLYDILKSSTEPMTVQQINEKLKETDYRSEAKQPYVVTFTALTKHPEMFRKVSRGLYEAVENVELNGADDTEESEDDSDTNENSK